MELLLVTQVSRTWRFLPPTATPQWSCVRKWQLASSRNCDGFSSSRWEVADRAPLTPPCGRGKRVRQGTTRQGENADCISQLIPEIGSASDWRSCILCLSNDTTRVMTWFNASYLIRSQSHVLGFNSRFRFDLNHPDSDDFRLALHPFFIFCYTSD